MQIGLVPMAAKPYHAGHHSLVTSAAQENDKVFLYVSTADRKRKGELTITGADMQKVWNEHIEGILPGNVAVVYGGSPVQHVFDMLIEANKKAVKGNLDHVYTVYSDPVDTASNYSERARQKYFPDADAAGNVKFAAEESPESFTRGVGTPDISGTTVRSFIQNGDFESFAQAMPAGINAKAVYDILSPITSEVFLRAYISEVIRR